MPPTITSLTTGALSGTSGTTASVSPAASSLVFVRIRSANSLGSNPTVSGLGLTWAIDVRSDPFGFRTIVGAIGTGTASAGTITITRGGSDTFNGDYEVFEVAGTSGKVQNKTASSASSPATFTLTFDAALGSGGATLAFIYNVGGNYASDPKSGWTELSDSNGFVTQTRTGADTSATADYTASGGASQSVQAYGIEFGASGGGASSAIPLLLHGGSLCR